LDDYYYYDEQKGMLVGKHTGNVYRIGDVLYAKIVRADKVRMEINFELTDEKVDANIDMEENVKSNEKSDGTTVKQHTKPKQTSNPKKPKREGVSNGTGKNKGRSSKTQR